MKTLRVLSIGVATVAASALLCAQTPMPTDRWMSNHGDYSGRRFSPLTKINTSNVNQLSMAWIFRVDGGGGANNNPRGAPLMADGVMYFSTTDNAWALDARTGKQIWHYTWASKGARHFSNRGMGMDGNTVYFETPDCNLVALSKEDGKLRWSKSIADIDQYYYCSVAPTVIGNHVIAGVSGDDADVPGFVEAHDPETGELQWKFYTVPMTKDDPALKTWPNLDMASHGGGMTWQPVTYDPETKMMYVTTGNPQPVIAYANRQGDNLYTASVVALNIDTGKMAWYFQTSPNDTHDWDATEAPVLFDAPFDGKPRKLLGIAARNGKFFVLDRTTGKALVHTDFVKTNWSLGYNDKGEPIPNPEKRPSTAGTLVSPNQGGGTNWYPPTFDPQTGLFYVNSNHAFSEYYLYDAGDNPQGWGGNDRSGYSESQLLALDYKTGKPKWVHHWESGSTSGLLSTAGGVLFTGGPGATFEALNAATGEPLWHTHLLSGVNAPPSTWELDGKQYVIVGGGDMLYAFILNNSK